MLTLNIHSKGSYPAHALSNFAPHVFRFDGIEIMCMEAFLQSLKFADITQQDAVLQMCAKEAKEAGTAQGWQTFLFWRGEKIDRYSEAYRSLIERAYLALYENPAFREALSASGRCILRHSIGKSFRRHTVLTKREFIRNLYKLRKKLRREKKQEGDQYAF